MSVKTKFKDTVAKRTRELFDSSGIVYGQCAQLALKLDMEACTVRQWKSRGYVTVEGAKLVEEKIGGKFTAHYLRPDVYA